LFRVAWSETLMPKFLEDKLKREYGESSAVPFKVMNKIGAMQGNKETAKGREMEAKHEADMKKAKVSVEPMREMRIEIHRGPKKQVTGFTVHHHMMPKPTKSAAFMENVEHSQPFGAHEHEAMMDHIDEHMKGQIGGTDAGAVKPKAQPGGASMEEGEMEEGE
jgi:hypothetical protein